MKEPPRGVSDQVVHGARGSAAGDVRVQSAVVAQELPLHDAGRRAARTGRLRRRSVHRAAVHARPRHGARATSAPRCSGSGFAGILGTASGGYVADRLAKRDVRWYVWLPGLATLIVGAVLDRVLHVARSGRRVLDRRDSRVSSVRTISARRSRWRRVWSDCACARSPRRSCCSS